MHPSRRNKALPPGRNNEGREGSARRQPRLGRFDVSVSAFLAQQRLGALAEGPRAELIGGRVVVPANPGPAEAAALAGLMQAIEAADPAAYGVVALRAAPLRLSPSDLLRADIALLREAGALPRGHAHRPAQVGLGIGGSFDPAAAVLIVEISAGRPSHEQRLPLYAAAGARDVWLLDLRRGWVEAFRSPWRGLYRSRTLWYPGERIPLVALAGLFIEALPPP